MVTLTNDQIPAVKHAKTQHSLLGTRQPSQNDLMTPAIQKQNKMWFKAILLPDSGCTVVQSGWMSSDLDEAAGYYSVSSS